MIQLKRAYDEPAADDGCRILVDRLWPRGVTRQRARIDHWPKAIAPSTELRRWFGHAERRWRDFQERYERELDEAPQAIAELLDIVRREPRVTLIYGARNTDHNHAIVLKDYLESRL